MGLAPLDFVGGGVSLIDAWLTRRQIDKWAKLIITMVMSYLTTFSATCGAIFVAEATHYSALVVILWGTGVGMVSGAGAAIVVWVHSPVTKDLGLAVPLSELNREAGNLGTDKDYAQVKGGK